MKRKHIHTDFIKFVFETYSPDGQKLPEDEEIEFPDDENEDEPLRKKIKNHDEFEEENEDEEIQDEEDEMNDEIIEKLLNEYKKLKKKYESNRIHNRIRR